MMPMMKKCTMCKELKLLSEFNRHRTQYDGLTRTCKSCNKIYIQQLQLRKSIYVDPRDKKEEQYRHWERGYGLTRIQVDLLLSKANHSCQLCGTKVKLCIDHNHITRQIRGILCHNCNTSIGKLGDTSERIQKVLDYLTKETNNPIIGLLFPGE